MPCPVSSWLGKSEINMHVQSCSYSTVFYLHNERAIWYIGCWIQTTFRSTYYSYGSTYYLWSTDSAGRVPHRSLMRGAASDMAARASMPHLSFFFFNGFVSTRLDSHQLDFYSHRLGQNQAESGHIGWQPKSALNHARTAEIGFEWGLNLSFLNFILKICCFFCVFFFVLCFLPSSFFVLWIKA